MKLTLSHFITAILITSLFYISFHLSFYAGVLIERKSQVCVGASELLGIKEDRKFFDDIYSIQQEEVEKLRKEVIELMGKLEKNAGELSSCYSYNFKLKSVIQTPENEFSDEGRQIN